MDRTDALLARFLDGVRPVVPLVALWAHGSLAAGDYRPGRSDLDLIAVVGAEVTEPQKAELRRIHEALVRADRLAAKLHCGYVAGAVIGDLTREHLAWAHEELKYRPVTPVTRRELLTAGRSMFGPRPAELLPPVTDAELTEFIRADLREFWLPATRHRVRWLMDIWVDLGLLTPARAAVALRDGHLITKCEALDVLTGVGAPARVVDDIRERRYAVHPRPTSWPWRLERAELTRTYAQSFIAGILADRRAGPS